ncbi:uncharacterized protein K02A2.6-like [Harmonia axyridis]|uniref:uncharacterized protein K02A2.6-like n=1 Tax=Harmonia axyridis TaxID=115357 RepID=UPI001E279ABD|nr:uncharacterized protein K02A2.6-like [Harmonia axyridis]
MRLESAFEVFLVPNEKKAAYLLHYMRPDAYDVLCDKVSPENPNNMEYNDLIKEMKQHYNPEPLEIAENFRFLQRKQNEGESVQQYLTTLQRLATTCKFGDYLKKALRNQFMFGLRTQNIQSRLLEMKDLTIERALEVAISMETSARDAAQLHRSNVASASVNSVKCEKGNNDRFSSKRAFAKSSSNNSKNVNFKNYCYRCGSPTHFANKCKHITTICSKCKVKGHLGKVCFKSKNTESTNQIEELFSIESEHIDYREKFMVKIKIEGKILIFEVDSGAAVSIMSYSMFKNFFPTLQIKKTDLKLVTYCKKVLDVVGYSRMGCIYETETHILNLYIVNTDRKPILGREWIRQLNIKLQNINQISVMNTPENILQKYPIVLEKSMGKILNIQARLKLKNNATPVFIRARKIPFALQSKVEEELLNLEKEGILVKVMRSEWATPIVPVVKANGKIRICGDFKITLNPNLIIDEYPLPSIENLFSTMAGGDKFTKLDLQQAYLQLEVHPDDQKFLTLSTPKGLFQCTRLMYGVASAPAIWQRLIENLLKDIPGVSVFLDDIKITAPDDNTHFERLEKVLCRLSDHNIRINYEKCEFMKDKIEYCGYVIDRSGIHKAKKKMDAIQNAKIPTNKTEVRAFTGLINYYGRFLENLSSKLYPIYNLLKEGVDFKWDIKCQRAFDTVKKEISSDRVLAHFDPQLTLILATDASPYAVGAVLSHVYPDGTERPIQFASQVLSTVQQKYSQIDKEAYSIIFGVKKFFYYLYGRRFTLVFREGERVIVREYLGFDKWQFGTVRKKLGSLIYLIELDDSRVWKRHVDQMRSMGEDTPLKISNTPSNTFIELPTILPSAKNNDNDYVAEKQNTLDGNVVQNKEIKPDGVPLKPEIPDDACTLRRSTRLRKAPSRLGIENCT